MKKQIKIHDKFFEPFISNQEIERAIAKVAIDINKQYQNKKPLFIGILNGSFLFFADLLKKIDIECEVAFLRVSSYQGTQTTGEVKKILGLDKSIENRDIIIVEDIVDTGITLDRIFNDLQKENPNSIKISTLLFKPKAYTKKIPVDFVGFEVGNEFLVGYGLDYNELGRNLNDIYIISENKMINLVLFGPPGAGKGTQSELIKKRFDLVHLSTGDMFRYHLKNETELGKLAKSYMDGGNLVPDEVVINMIDSRLDYEKGAKGFIFDGFPRTLDQAKALDELLEKKGWEISNMVSLEVDQEELVKRLLLRGKESGRKDDQDESVIRNRMNVYETQTAPLKNYYANQGKHKSVEGTGSIEEISEKIAVAIS